MTCDLSYIDFTLWTFTKCGTVDGNKIFLSGSCSLSILTRSKTNWELSTSSRRDIRKRLSFMRHRWAWSKAWQVLQGREVRSRKTKPCIQTKEITLGFLCYLKTPCYFLWWILLLEVTPLFFPFSPVSINQVRKYYRNIFIFYLKMRKFSLMLLAVIWVVCINGYFRFRMFLLKIMAYL